MFEDDSAPLPKDDSALLFKKVTPHSIKLAQSEKLQEEVEQFLASGGKINTNPTNAGAFGHQKNRDAFKIPPDLQTILKSDALDRIRKRTDLDKPQEPETSERELEIKRAVESVTKRKELEQKKLKAINEKKAKEKAEMERKKKEKREAAALKRAEKMVNVIRVRTVIARRKEAEEKGLSTFFAPCKFHGETEYSIYKNGTRCKQCRTNQVRNKPVQRPRKSDYEENAFRQSENRKWMDAALKAGLQRFEGDCVNCGMTTMRIKNNPKKIGGHLYNCVNCMNKSTRHTKEGREKARALASQARLERFLAAIEARESKKENA